MSRRKRLSVKKTNVDTSACAWRVVCSFACSSSFMMCILVLTSLAPAVGHSAHNLRRHQMRDLLRGRASLHLSRVR